MGGIPRGKATGQIDILKAEIERNARLYHVFSICEQLGIDDPIHWMNMVSPVVIDFWIAYRSVKFDLESAAYDNASGNKEMTPEDASVYIHSLVGSNVDGKE